MLGSKNSVVTSYNFNEYKDRERDRYWRVKTQNEQ